MIRHLSIDIETYSSVSIRDAGLYKYVQSGDFKVLLFAYSFDGEYPKIIDLAQGEHIPLDVQIALFSPEVIKHAYNAAFEWYCLSKHFQVRAQEKWLSQWRCTMVHGLYCGMIGGLGKVGEALGLPADKQKDRIEVGDEVQRDGHKFIVTKIIDDTWFDGVDANGTPIAVIIANVTKTGKHYDIASILEAMRE